MLESYHVRREIKVIPTGLELDNFSVENADPSSRHTIREQYGFKDEDKIIIYVGRLAEEKALDIVVKGIANTIQKGINIKMMIVGDGPDFDRLSAMIKEFGIEDSCVMTGAKIEKISQLYIIVQMHLFQLPYLKHRE